MSAEDRPVGYRNPPKHSQWQPGQSGNPSGRPKRTVRLNNLLKDVANGPITVQENGCDREVTKLEAMVRTLVVSSLRGDMKAMRLFLNLWAGAEAEALSEENEEQVKNIHALSAAKATLRRKENEYLRQKPACTTCDAYIEKHLRTQPKVYPPNYTDYNGHPPGYLAEQQAARDAQKTDDELWDEIERLTAGTIKWHTDDDFPSDKDNKTS